MKYGRSKADPCLYFRWTMFGLVLWSSWVDDYCFVAGKEADVLKAKALVMELVDCDDVRKLLECVGCKVDYNKEGGRYGWCSQT
jgi:hypothetical protein